MMSHISLGPAAESKPIREIAYETLKHAIITGDLPAGSRIVETDYADRMHISRTPLREALRKLERDGLVEYVLRRGVVVRAFTIADVEEIYTIRNSLEMLTLPAIIERATDEHIADLRRRVAEMDELLDKDDVDAISPLARAFHWALLSISNQHRILRVIESQDEYINRFSLMAIRQENHKYEAQAEHRRMVDLVEARDLEGLRQLMRAHSDLSKQRCLEALAAQKQNRDL